MPVAVIDTGLDVDHPEFMGRISDALRNFGSDKDHTDVSHSIINGNVQGHGTHVAGIIGAARDGQGMHGVAYEATILPLQAVVKGNPENEAIKYAVEAGAKVLNGSFGPITLRKELADGRNPDYTQLDYKPIRGRSPPTRRNTASTPRSQFASEC